MTGTTGEATTKTMPINSEHYENPFTKEDKDFSGCPVLTGTTKYEPFPGAKNILITGGAGFIGSWAVRHFVKTYANEYNIIVYDVLDVPSSLQNFRCLLECPNFKFVRGDITDSAKVEEAMRENEIDSVIHFAAQSHVDLSFGNSYSFTHVNVMGTHVMLECAKKQRVKRFIHVSTDEVYGEVHGDEEDLLETAILSPTNPYAASKAAAEMLVNAYYKSFKLPVIIVRSNNVYGPTQYPEKIIPKFALSLHLGKKIFLHGDGTNTRRYLYGQDAADAFDTIFHKGVVGQIYNVGSEAEVANIDLCHQILALFGKDNAEDYAKIVEHSKDRPFNDARYAVDGGKLKALGWQQKVPFSEGLAKTVYWFINWGQEWWGHDVSTCCVAFPENPETVQQRDWEEYARKDIGYGTSKTPGSATSDYAPTPSEECARSVSELSVNGGAYSIKHRVEFCDDKGGKGVALRTYAVPSASL